MKGFDYKKYRKIVDSSFTSVYPSGNIIDKICQRASFLRYKFENKKTSHEDYAYLKRQYSWIIPLQEKARQNGGLAGDYQWQRLAEISRFLRRYAPTTVCELGSGTSTAMFAHFIRDPKRFVTVEESEYWQKRMYESIGDLRHDITGVRADRIVAVRDDESTTHYDIDHSKAYDLVYVDGPSSQPMEGDRNLKIKDPNGHMPNIDVELFWKNGCYPKIILIDGRRSTVRRLIQSSHGKYDVFLSSRLLASVGLPSAGRFCYHTLLVYKT